MTSYFPTPIFDIPWKSHWRKNIESMFGLPDVDYAKPKPVLVRKRRGPGKPMPRGSVLGKDFGHKLRACNKGCGRKIRDDNRTGDCYICQKSYPIMAGPKPVCQCGKIMNRKTKYGVCARCADLRRWRGHVKSRRAVLKVAA